MLQSKIKIKVGDISFSGEGNEAWLGEQINTVLETAKEKTCNDSEDEIDASDSFTTYLEYNKVLRNWFVVYGISGAVFFLVKKEKGFNIDYEGLRLIAISLLIGVGVQIIGAFINKVANWCVHRGYTNKAFYNTKCHKFSVCIAEKFWIDVLLDCITMLAFGYAAWILISTLNLKFP